MRNFKSNKQHTVPLTLKRKSLGFLSSTIIETLFGILNSDAGRSFDRRCPDDFLPSSFPCRFIFCRSFSLALAYHPDHLCSISLDFSTVAGDLLLSTFIFRVSPVWLSSILIDVFELFSILMLARPPSSKSAQSLDHELNLTQKPRSTESSLLWVSLVTDLTGSQPP